ncbi:MAG: hypothetical protein CMJ48_07140 [Planctomycetaceae bacterium]|nr:hypothetical protein [Planctomycetaceae bacterium]
MSANTHVEGIFRAILVNRPVGQIASIASQLVELLQTANERNVRIRDDQPIAMGIAGGRLRIAFMHPDMSRFYGPAWQMPIGAADVDGREQIVMLIQSSNDHRIHLHLTNPLYRESTNYISADDETMYPDSGVSDLYSYEVFGTHMAEKLLASFGYFTDEELQSRRDKHEPLPPPHKWVSNNLRRPFSLLGNAIASLRTLRDGPIGANVSAHLGKESFRGLCVTSTGGIPQGGFASSSAVTVAAKNALNALYDLGIDADRLIQLACQAEYGTGVRAGSLDQATEQIGKVGQGTLISSNPRDHHRVIGDYPVPSSRFQTVFVYSVDRDRDAWRWSAGLYGRTPESDRLTTIEIRKMTGKAAELAAILVRLPLDVDFFQVIEDELVRDGVLGPEKLQWVYGTLRDLPLLATCEELRRLFYDQRQWYTNQLVKHERLDKDAAAQRTDAIFDSLFVGWHTPLLRRVTRDGRFVEESGVPLRAIVGYLFAEVARNFYLIHHTDQWIEYVTRSQWGDRCVDIDPERLPSIEEMVEQLDWEKGLDGPQVLEAWLERCGAMPFNYNQDLEDEQLSAADPLKLHLIRGTNFFRGLPLIDLVEAMLKRAFGRDAVAVRINAAGQGDFFQVHVDTECANINDVKAFVQKAFYSRFGIHPENEFVEPHPGGPAVGVRLARYDQLPELIRRLEAASRQGGAEPQRRDDRSTEAAIEQSGTP